MSNVEVRKPRQCVRKVKVIQQEWVSMRNAEQTVDLPVPKIMEEIVGVARMVPPVQHVRDVLGHIRSYSPGVPL